MKKNAKICVVVATHKQYSMPSDEMYLPIQAGAALHKRLPYIGDNTGENISTRNPYYCELTCLYWAWKNIKTDYIGLCHYRRYFSNGVFGAKVRRILTLKQAQHLLTQAPVILPRPRNYWIETNYSQYVHAHHAQDLDVTHQILQERYPMYISAYDALMNRTTGHRFNMLIMRKDVLNSYCEWLFDILFELENRLDISDYSDYDARVFGFVGERLLDVWMEVNNVHYKEVAVVNMERQHRILKGVAFLRRKFCRKPHIKLRE